MERREFLQHSLLIAGATVVGLPLLNVENAAAGEAERRVFEGYRPRLHGSAKTGCARFDPGIEFPDPGILM